MSMSFLKGNSLELVSKELHNFGAIAAFFRDWALRTPSFMRHLSVSLLPNLGKTLQLPQSYLTPWTLTLEFLHFHKMNLEFSYR